MPVEAGTSETSGSGIAGEAPPPAEPFVWFPLWYAIQFFFLSLILCTSLI
jgi:hypothetical protein